MDDNFNDVPNQTGWGTCEMGHGQDGEKVHPESIAFASDASSYAAILETHKTFGCIMHPLNILEMK